MDKLSIQALDDEKWNVLEIFGAGSRDEMS